MDVGEDASRKFRFKYLVANVAHNRRTIAIISGNVCKRPWNARISPFYRHLRVNRAMFYCMYCSTNIKMYHFTIKTESSPVNTESRH
jgi:hypothetical protein